MAIMPKGDPQVRISPEQNQLIAKLALEADFSKEQFVAMLLSDALQACQSEELNFTLPRIALIRLKLGRTKPDVLDLKSQIAEALAEQLPLAIAEALKNQAAPKKRNAA